MEKDLEIGESSEKSRSVIVGLQESYYRLAGVYKGLLSPHSSVVE
jgi:hypothetical protein